MEQAQSDSTPSTAPEKQHFTGYPKLARLMSRAPETTIFRRFNELNLINLLRLQAELQDMEHQLQQIREEDAQSSDQVREFYVTDFRLMRDWRYTGDPLQYDLLVSIGNEIQDYSPTPCPLLEIGLVRLIFLRQCTIAGTSIEQS